MSPLDQIQKDIQELPEKAQNLLMDLIEILKKRYPKPIQPEDIPKLVKGMSAFHFDPHPKSLP